MDMTELTLDYYNKNAEIFTQNTLNVSFSAIQNEFLRYIPHKGKILDLGCGAGRDSKAFLSKGYLVTPVDGSQEICRIAEKNIGRAVVCARFEDLDLQDTYHGIWACASLLHLTPERLEKVLCKIASLLEADGWLYMSFKYGSFSGIRNGRYFHDMNEQQADELFRKIRDMKIEKLFLTADGRPERANEQWLNILARRQKLRSAIQSAKCVLSIQS